MMEIRIVYTGARTDKFDDSITEFIERETKLMLWASGYNFKTQERELKFDDKKD